ncbi:MAG: hypothetical protein Q4D89_11360 [Arachnia propionica]|uniref:hypothetical protein n=1 Tax=Arachnia propionica TaxID=1750 RepID=UPI002706FA77|nr:hypothetical protein [Arachnia propionica]
MGKSTAEVMRFDLPFHAEPPPLTFAGADITSLVERRSTSHHIDVTVLDTSDDRLLRAGIVLAHRVQGGVGGWYLSAPGWQPHLPAERSMDIDATAELPAQFVAWIRPFIRRATVGPVAGLECERRDYVMRGEDGELGTIRDEQVTVLRGGVTVARYREATFTLEHPTPERCEAVTTAMAQVAGARVMRFPTLQQRLGPPASGFTDFPEPIRGRRREVTLEAFVTWLFATDLRALVAAVLSAPDTLVTLFSDIRGHARGLASVLDPAWLRELDELLLGEPGSRVLEVIDVLVGAVRAPRLGDASREPAARLLLRRAEHGARILAERCRMLSPDSPDRDWGAAHAAAEQLCASGAVAAHLHGKAGRRVMKRLTGITRALGRCADVTTVDSLDGLGAPEAFELGRRVERCRQRAVAEREAFVTQWPDHVSEVTRLLTKARR